MPSSMDGWIEEKMTNRRTICTLLFNPNVPNIYDRVVYEREEASLFVAGRTCASSTTQC